MTIRRFVAAVVAGTLGGAVGSGARAAPPPPAIPVMVLGTYHMGNPGRDLHNAKIAPVTTPAKQAELAALAKRLAAFRPTVIAVERDSDAADLADPGYAKFTAAELARNPNEVTQIGYRVAALTGARVIAIDVQEKPGEPSYFPYDPVADWAKAHPAAQVALGRSNAAIAGFTSGLERDQSRLTVTQILARMNGAGAGNQTQLHRDFYYGALRFGDRDAQPGAELNGRWYTRNAKIFAKLAEATRPDDRVLVVYGAGHLFWLKHFATETPGFRLVEATSVLGR